MSSKQPVGVIGAMDSELSSLVAALKGREDRTLHGLVFYTGTLEDSPVVLVKCGVGKVNAARTAQVRLRPQGFDQHGDRRRGSPRAVRRGRCGGRRLGAA